MCACACISFIFATYMATLYCIHVCAGVYRRGRHEGMTPLPSAATHGSIQSQQTMGHASGIPGHGMYGVHSIV